MENNVASERMRLGLSQEGLAEELHVSRDVIKNIESGKTPIKSPMLCAMGDLFGCSLDYIMARTNDRLSHVRNI